MVSSMQQVSNIIIGPGTLKSWPTQAVGVGRTKGHRFDQDWQGDHKQRGLEDLRASSSGH